VLALAAALACIAGDAQAQAAEHRVLVIGDSISQGAAGDATWRYQLWTSLEQSPAAGTVDFIGSRQSLFNYVTGKQDGGTAYLFPAFDQDHESLWGQKLQTAASQVPATLAALPESPTAIVVALGTNDVGGGAAKAEANLRKLVGSARSAAPGVDIVVLAPYPTWNTTYGVWRNQSYFSAFQTAARRVAAQADNPEERVVTIAQTGFNARTMTWDGTHPNAPGELTIAAAAAQGLAAIGIGDGPHLPATATWAATAAAPSLTASGKRVIISWPDGTPGALGYNVQQRHTSAKGVVGSWATPKKYTRGVRTYTTSNLVLSDTYDFRIVPTRKLMTGTPGPAATIQIGTAAG
jgi:lysophospholipase L1-like esterase